MTHDTTNYTEAAEAARQALDYIERYANNRGRDTFAELAAQGRLVLRMGHHPDGSVWGQYFDAEALPCWDGCDGVLTFHRSGWCRTHPEHADRDCNCDGGHDDWTDEDEAAYWEPTLDPEDGDDGVVTEDYEQAAQYMLETKDAWDNMPDWEPDFEADNEAAFDEDAAIYQAEARYESWLGRT